MEPIVLPKLSYPFPPGINSYAAAVNQYTIDWACRFNLITQEYTNQHRHKLQYGFFAARFYPNTSSEILQIAADLLTWLFFMDDQCDEASIGKQTEELEKLYTRCCTILEGAEPTDQDKPLFHALYDLRTRLVQQASITWMCQFSRNMAAYFTANCWEATNRIRGIIPDLTSYREMRPFTGCVYPFIDLLSITDQIHLPVTVQDHPFVQQLSRMASNIICWCNDILSVKKELQHGEVHNLVLVLQQELHCTLQEAVDFAAVEHDAEVAAFVALTKQLPSFGPTVDADFVRYVAGLCALIRATLDWSLTAERYQTST